VKISVHWLRQWVDMALDTPALAQALTMAGIEVEAIEAAAPAFSGVVVGLITQCQPHPQADRLRICQVETGTGTPLQIVCGAANARTDLRAPLALVGARLPDSSVIKAAKLRGVESCGMLCSAKELGLSEAAEGLLELDADAQPGMDLRAYLALDDQVLELGITPNRGDCLSMAGIAREVAAITSTPLSGPHFNVCAPVMTEAMAVEVAVPQACPHYVGRVITNLDISRKTPLWMRERLRRVGIRSMHPIVDVTNYVMIELGQPLHAFDRQGIQGGIQVRWARPGETLRLLNEQTVELRSDTLVIADADRALALAGIMGGADSAVTSQTRSVFLESALFDALHISGRARQYGLHTEASYRYERGIDPQLQRQALERATTLLLEIMNGEAGPIVEVDSRACEAVHIRLRASRLHQVLGFAVPSAQVSNILARLGIMHEQQDEDWCAQPPSYRYDLREEIDLIEEVARLHGYQNLPATPVRGELRMVEQPEQLQSVARLREVMVQRGYHEAITYSFVDPEVQRHFHVPSTPIDLVNPLSRELSQMRSSLWPGLIQALQHNLNRQQLRVRLFEIGMVFNRMQADIEQRMVLAGLAYGPVFPEQWGTAARRVDFFDVKADVAVLVPEETIRYEAASHPDLHPGQAACLWRGEQQLGWLGSLHPRLVKLLDLPATPVVFQLELPVLRVRELPRFQVYSKFPSVRRDLAFIIAEEVDAAMIAQVIRAADPGLLQELEFFDVYQGKGVKPGSKSVAISLIFQAQSRTLEVQEVDAAVAEIIAAMQNNLHAKLRE